MSPRLSSLGRVALLLLIPFALWGRGACDAAADPAPATQPVAIMRLDEVRIGMKGYGLTVFHEAKIEPFNVEVVSVMRDFTPGKGVIWIRCPDDRLQQTGPVAGMSGSPIYLWDESDQTPHQPGHGGRLIGAFAFGFPGSKDCYAGVQSIEAMLAVGRRARPALGTQPPAGAQAATSGNLLRTLLTLADQKGLSQGETWRTRALAQVFLQPTRPGSAAESSALDTSPNLRPLSLPLPLPSATLASYMAPLLESIGLTPLATGAPMLSGKPPVEIDPAQIRFAPGSVLALPLAFGDMDLSAIGTVTTVLPDGRVLGFGHAMFGEGPAALPMATGYVHYIVPQLNTSFKLGGSAMIRGALVRDENCAIAGRPDGQFRTAAAQITVNLPDQPPRVYHYQIALHRRLTPIISAIVTATSLTADAALPADNTLHVRGQLRFAGDRRLGINSLIPSASEAAVVQQLLPPIALMMDNDFQAAPLEALDLHLDVEPRVRRATLVSGRLDHARVRPGDTLGISILLQPHGQEEVARRLNFALPPDLADGDYMLTVCDAKTYQALQFQARPYLRTIARVDDILAVIREIMGVPDDALYVVLQLPQRQGVAIGREELPQLPSSRRAMLATPTNTQAIPCNGWAWKMIPMDTVPMGQLLFPVSVHKDLPRNGP